MLCLRCLLPVLAFAVAPLAAESAAAERGVSRLNILLITADDLNYDSLGVTGCKTPDITPNLDRLASQGMLFERAHVTIAVCQPCREVLMTGRYPHHNGALGFQPIRRDVPTLGEQLEKAGYFKGIMAKVSHLAPIDKYRWDVVVNASDLAVGRDPKLYYQHAKAFFAAAAEANKPFFLMANAQDPHRPFAGSDQEKGRRKRARPATAHNKPKRANRRGNFPPASRYYKPSEVAVPGFLPDLPQVRLEIAEYYSSVHRCDEVVGAVLRALKESGREHDTLVMFLSDHGMALPFAKTNCYRHSTRTPWIVRWPGVVKPGSRDRQHFISGIDFLPTILAAAKLSPLEGVDGRSFLPLLRGEKQTDRDSVLTCFYRTSGRREYPMRSVIAGRYGYIYNGWSDGRTVFRNESQNGRTMNAMRQAADNPKIAARVKLFLYRVPEELYDYQADPDALKNLVDDPAHRETLDRMRKMLGEKLRACGDPLADQYSKQVLGAGKSDTSGLGSR